MFRFPDRVAVFSSLKKNMIGIARVTERFLGGFVMAVKMRSAMGVCANQRGHIMFPKQAQKRR